MRTSACLFVALCSLPACAQISRPAVKDRPVTIVQTTVNTRTLADGTHVTTTKSETYYRNGSGTTRDDMTMPLQSPRQGDFHFSNIVDMDTRESIHWSKYDDRPEATGIVRQKFTDATSALPEAAATAPEHKLEELGASEANGIACERQRYTFTYAAHTRGNDQPFVVVQEECVSRDYGILTETLDSPIGGTSVTTLESLTPGEPDASHFQPPTDLPETASR